MGDAATQAAVAIALLDRPLGERVRTANILEVKGEGATLRVPLDASAVALERLDSCFEKNSRSGLRVTRSSRRVGSLKQHLHCE